MRNQAPRRAAKQAGFTLIELIMVIVIIGILAAVAVPKFTDLSSSARTAALDGVAGNIASASGTNYALYASGKGGTAVTTCSAALGLVNVSGSVTYTISETGGSGGAGGTKTCTVSDGTGTSGSFTITTTG